MRLVLPVLMVGVGVGVGAGCGFSGQGSDLLPGPDEGSLLLATAAELAAGAELTDAFVAGEAGTLGPGTLEPVTWVPGRLLAELDDKNGPFDATWGSRPPRAQLVNRGLMAPVFANQVPPGATGNDYVVWLSGQLFLDAGAQRIQVAAAPGAVAFADILDEKNLLVHCSATAAAGCTVTAAAAGWHTLRLGLRRPPAATSHAFELRWAAGAVDPLAAVPASRVRVAAHTEELAGWRIDLFASQRGMEPVQNGAALNASDPFTLTWNQALLGGQSGSPHYRNAGQLRLLEAGSYDFAFDAGRDTSVRLWIDGEWVGPANAFDATSTDPRPNLMSRTLTAGWHDVVLEAYKEGGLSGSVTLTYARSGQARQPPLRADVRPVLGPSPTAASGANLNSVPLTAGVMVSRAATLTGVPPSPKAIAVDVSFSVRAQAWTGFTAMLVSPAGVRAPLAFPGIATPTDRPVTLHASVPAAQLGGIVDVYGTWTLEVTHPAGGGPLDPAVHVLRNFRINAHYLGTPQTSAAARAVAQTARYARMISLDEARALTAVRADAIVPEGSAVALSAQLCSDAAGTACQPALSAEQLAAQRPTTQHLKLIVTLTSDGFATPIVQALGVVYRR